MSKRLGLLTFGEKDHEVFLGRDFLRDKNYSESTAITIDAEVRRIIDECYDRAKKILKENLDKLKKLSGVLLEKEVLESEEIKQIVGMGEAVGPQAVDPGTANPPAN
jgi:cell division protease FtsH